MDAVKFIEERNRMCKSFGDRCNGCPASDACGCCAVDQAVDQASTLDATAQVAIVEKWSAAHPRKTRSVFRYEETDENKIECRQCQHIMFSDTEKELAQIAKREYARKWRAENRDKVKAANERYWLRRAVKTMAAADEPEKAAMEKGDKWK